MIAHGTLRGYQAHRAAGEDPCEPCRVAQNTYRNALRQGQTPPQAS